MVERQLKAMSGRILEVRLQSSDVPPTPSSGECCGLLKLSVDDYDDITGIKLSSENQIL
jgi:hypothetical protein